MEKLPKISVITPSYNQGCFIEQTICSVIDQGYPNLEYIIIDGGSTDNSVDIIKKYEKHISYWVSEKDKGQSDAINKGYLKATGEVINWLNSDDYYETGSLNKVGEAFKDPLVNVYCGISRIFGDGNEYYSHGTDIYPGNLEKTIGWARIDQPETFMRKRIWDTLGAVDDQFHYTMDKELWIRYLLTYGLNGIIKTKELLAHFRLHSGSKTTSQKEGFHKEGFNLFYSMAIDNGLLNEAAFFSNHFNSVHIRLNHNRNHGDIEKVMHYFFYYQMEEAYALNDTTMMNLIQRYLDPSLLSSEDREKYFKLYWRSRLIPLSLKKWWNRS